MYITISGKVARYNTIVQPRTSAKQSRDCAAKKAHNKASIRATTTSDSGECIRDIDPIEITWIHTGDKQTWEETVCSRIQETMHQVRRTTPL